MADETTPLLNQKDSSNQNDNSNPLADHHSQFCLLVGLPPENKPGKSVKWNTLDDNTLYRRALRKARQQDWTYTFTAAISNFLLLAQVVLSATLTALGAADSSHVLITIFGVLNTIIAGLVAYLKSRGQPMRARMFRDDLEHLVEEIENSKTMWLGVKHQIHGYDEVDVDDQVSVRSEVARLTRLYESAVKKYKHNNPELYNLAGGTLDPVSGLRARPGQGAMPVIDEAAGGGGEAGPAAAPDVENADDDPTQAVKLGKPKRRNTSDDKDDDDDDAPKEDAKAPEVTIEEDTASAEGSKTKSDDASTKQTTPDTSKAGGSPETPKDA